MLPKTFRERFGWAISCVIEKRDLSNVCLADKLGVDKNTINNYRQIKAEPKASFVKKFCDTFKFNIMWIFDGTGEPYYGAHAEFPEVCGPEKSVPPYEPLDRPSEQPQSQTVFHSSPGVDQFAQAVSHLKTIFDSHDTAFIQAITINLSTVARAIDREKEHRELCRKINLSKDRIAELESRLQSQNPAASDNTGTMKHPTTLRKGCI